MALGDPEEGPSKAGFVGGQTGAVGGAAGEAGSSGLGFGAQFSAGNAVEVLRGLLMGVERSTKIIVGLSLLVSLVASVSDSVIKIFGLIPGYTLSSPYYFWNFFTAGFVEDSIWKALIGAFLLLVYGKYLEASWGSYEFTKFILLINTLIGITTCFIVVIAYGFNEDETLLYSKYWCGMSGILVACSVAGKQLNPEYEIGSAPLMLRAKYIPSVFILVLFIAVFLGLPGETYLPFNLLGLFYSWLYLRFFQKRGETKGDFSDSFAFATFFPEAIQPYVGIVTALIYGVARFLPCFKVSTEKKHQAHTFIDQGAGSLADPADAERRRQRALKALDSRMAQIKEASMNTTDTEKTSNPTNADSQV